MSDFPSEYGALPNLKEQGRIWLATLPTGVVAFFGPVWINQFWAIPGNALSLDSFPVSIFVITSLCGATYGCNHSRFFNFSVPWFSVTWRAFAWTLVTAGLADPMLLFGIVMIPTLSLTGWAGMIFGYTVASKVQLLIRKRHGDSISERA